MQAQDPPWQAAATAGPASFRWRTLPPQRATVVWAFAWTIARTIPWRQLLWPALPVAAAAIGLLLAFQQVVRQAVVQGEQRRSAVIARADGAWRCNTLAKRNDRDDCLSQLGSGSVDLPRTMTLAPSKAMP